MSLQNITVASIEIGERLRKPGPAAVAELAKSMQLVGSLKRRPARATLFTEPMASTGNLEGGATDGSEGLEPNTVAADKTNPLTQGLAGFVGRLLELLNLLFGEPHSDLLISILGHDAFSRKSLIMQT